MENYVDQKPIGEGAFGKVFKARRKHTGQIVALKFIKKKNRTEKDLKNLRQEIDILRRLKHENIVLLQDTFETKIEICLVTEYCQGELFEILEEDQSMPEAEIRKIAMQQVSAQHYLHSNRIIHRDMKPQNVLISANGVVKLCDFGFARAMSTNTLVLTSIKGTPLYMSPELVKEQPYGNAADLWSLGVIQYELFVGQPPFFTNNLMSLIKLIIKDPVKYPDNMSDKFKDFLKGLLNKDPSRRLNWPNLLHHPFLKETEEEEKERKKRTEKYKTWIGLNFQRVVEGSAEILENNDNNENLENEDKQVHNKEEDANVKTNDPQKFEDGNYGNYTLGSNADECWRVWMNDVQETKGANLMRKNTGFLENLLKLLQMNMNDILNNENDRNLFVHGLRILSQIVMNSDENFSSQIDILKNKHQPNNLINKLKQLLRNETFENAALDIISCLTMATALVSKAYYDENEGIEAIFSKKFLGLIPTMLEIGAKKLQVNSSLQSNAIKAVGNQAQQASLSLPRNRGFYEEQGNAKIIETLAKIQSTTATNIKIIVQQNNIVNVFSILVHPMNGEMFSFPWNRGPLEISEFSGVLNFIDQFVEYVFKVLKNYNMITNIGKLYVLPETETSTKQSIIRILLQYGKKSKENCASLAKSPEFKQILGACVNSGDSLIFGTFTQIYSLVVKNLGFQQADQFEFHPNYILEEFDKNINDHPYISVICLNTIGIYIAQSEEVYYQLKKQLSSKSFIKKVGILFSTNLDKMTEVKKLDGSCYNFPQNGYYDGIFTYMNAFFGRQSRSREDLPVLFLTLKELNFNDKLINIIKNLSQKSEISPKGFLSYLMLICDFAYAAKYGSTLGQELFKEDNVKNLVALLNESQFNALSEWPMSSGGGPLGNELLITQIIRILQIPFSSNILTSETERVASFRLLKDCNVVDSVQNSLAYLNNEKINLVFSLLAKQINAGEIEKDISTQFYQASGLQIIKKYKLQNSENSTVQADVLSMICQFCRISKNYYKPIHELNIYSNLKSGLGHDDPSVRAKICNVVGHMCRHSDFFYDMLKDTGLISECINCCWDTDSATRKFACFALGNAAFHNDKLYKILRTSIPHVVKLQKDNDERTRANASGALGNYARNSNFLIDDQVKAGAIHLQLQVACNDNSLNAKRVALFSLGNICAYNECKKMIENNGQFKDNIQNIIMQMNSIKCTTFIKYANRFLQRLKTG